MLVDSQAAIKALIKCTVTSITVLNCIRNLNQLGKQNHVSIAWIPAHAVVSRVRRILKKRGAKNFRKFGKNKDLKQKLFLLNLVRFFAQNQVKSKNKNKSLHSNLVRFSAQSLEETHRMCLLCDQALCPTCKGGGACLNFAYFSMQFYNPDDPKGGHGTMPPPKYAPGRRTRQRSGRLSSQIRI